MPRTVYQRCFRPNWVYCISSIHENIHRAGDISCRVHTTRFVTYPIVSFIYLSPKSPLIPEHCPLLVVDERRASVEVIMSQNFRKLSVDTTEPTPCSSRSKLICWSSDPLISSENNCILHSSTRRSLFEDESDDFVEPSLLTIQQNYSRVPDAPHYPERQSDSSGMNETETALCPEQLCSPKFAPMEQETASPRDSIVLT